MADDGLDDFFAKKDKSKKKPKSSRIKTDDILAEHTVDGDSNTPKETKKGKKSKKEKESAKNTASKARGDDEWNEVQDEDEKDYTGLRISNLQRSEREGQEEGQEEEEKEDEDEEEDENGEVKERKETKDAGQQGPWSGASQPPPAKPAPPPVEEPKPVPVEEPTPAAAKAPAKYVPPAARAGGAATTSATPLRRVRKGVAPNLTSEDDFPTLGGGAPAPMGDSDRKKFEKVSSGGRHMVDPKQQSMQLSLGNKYAALQD